MSEWKEYTLGDIAVIKNGFAFKGTDFIENGIPVIKIKNVKPNKIVLDNLAYVSDVTALGKDYYKIKSSDILITMSGNRADGSPDSWVGKVALFKLNGEFLLNQRVSALQIKNDICSTEFIAYHLSSWETQLHLINEANSSGGQANISPEIVKRLALNIPPLPEQTAIASILSSLDDKIDLFNRQNATLEKMAETLFRQWFVEEAKEEWEAVKVGDFVSTNLSTVTKNYPYDIIEYLDTSSLSNGLIGELQTLKLSDAPSRAKRLVKHNDILISTVRPDQKHYGIIKDPIDNIVVSTGFCVISCSKISPHFIYLLLTNNEMTEFLHSIAEGSTSTYPSLKPSDIEKIEFFMPPKNKLDEFEKICSTYWDKIKSNQTQIRTLTTLRDTLLPKLMSGELRVKM